MIGTMSDLCKWMPKTMLKNLHEVEEMGCYVITDEKKDIRRNKKKEIIEWISRGYKNLNLIGKVPSKNILKLPYDKGYALKFNKNRYFGNCLEFMITGCGFLCVTFQTESRIPQTLVSNYTPDNPDFPFNEISVDASSIFIIGFDNDKHQVNIPVQHNCRKWTTLYVEWSVDEDCNLYGSYIVDNDRKVSNIFNFKLGFVCGD